MSLNIHFLTFLKGVQVQFVNTNMQSLIKNLEQRNISAIALTGWWAGKYGKITAMKNMRFNDLKQLNISFVNTSPFKKKYDFFRI